MPQSPCFVPSDRLRVLGTREVRAEGEYVLYWMTSARRAGWNFALEQAIGHARELERPLLVFEALRSGYRWASDRIHRFVLDGMVVNARRFEAESVLYRAYVEPEPDAGKGLLAALAEPACVVVTDEFPDFFLPRMLAAAADQISARLEVVDSNGLLPLAAADKAYKRAVDFRRFLQKNLGDHLLDPPAANPFDGVDLPRLEALPEAIDDSWPELLAEVTRDSLPELASLPIDHEVAPAEGVEGGSDAALERWHRFLEERLERYEEGRLDLEDRSTSALSPYLHFGHISAHQVFAELVEREEWSPGDLSSGPHRGQREGWWGMGKAAESFLDELVTWRELSYNGAAYLDDHHRYESLPEWARESLERHSVDEREHVYELEEFEQARTHDELWNAAQRELRQTGTMHNYLRMLWGKKVLEWTASPRDALEVLIELNNKFAYDGRNPNSYSGIFWCLGRYDRAWGPERPIFGKIRFMSSASARRKLQMGSYLERFGPESTG